MRFASCFGSGFSTEALSLGFGRGFIILGLNSNLRFNSRLGSGFRAQGLGFGRGFMFIDGSSKF